VNEVPINLEEGDELLTVEEIAEKTSVHTNTVRNLLTRFKLSSVGVRQTSAKGQPAKLYSFISYQGACEVMKDLEGFNKLSESGKTKFIVGHSVDKIRTGSFDERKQAVETLNQISEELGDIFEDMYFENAHLRLTNKNISEERHYWQQKYGSEHRKHLI
jgi:hypothetical protein